MTVDGKGADPTRPAISVCVPMYDNAATIERCLQSVLAQQDVQFEIVVVDDDSSDECAAIAQELLRPGDRYIRNSPRLGLNGNHNRCLQVARGDLIQFVHGDDWLLPGALRELAKYFEDPSVGMAFAPRDIESDDPRWKEWNGNLHAGFRRLEEYNDGRDLVVQIASRGVYGNWIGEPTCVMFRRQLALDAGQCRMDVYQLVDLDLWLRIMLRSRVCFHPDELSVHSYTSNTATARIVGARKDWLDRLRVLTSLIVDPASPSAVQSRARLWWRVVRVRNMLQCAMFGPSRRERIRHLCDASTLEFEIARSFYRNEVHQSPSPNTSAAPQ